MRRERIESARERRTAFFLGGGGGGGREVGGGGGGYYFLYIIIIKLVHGCMAYVKLLPSRHTFCVHHTTMHQFTVSLRSEPHTHRVHVCLAVSCYLHFRQNGRDLSRATAVTREWNRYRNTSSLFCLQVSLWARRVP